MAPVLGLTRHNGAVASEQAFWSQAGTGCFGMRVDISRDTLEAKVEAAAEMDD